MCFSDLEGSFRVGSVLERLKKKDNYRGRGGVGWGGELQMQKVKTMDRTLKYCKELEFI